MQFGTRIVVTVVSISLIGLASAPCAHAGQPTNGGAIPQGSYIRSCNQISFDPSAQILRAQCNSTPPSNSSGVAQALGAGPGFQGIASAELHVAACNPGADIENLNGRLQCQALSGTWGEGGAVPNGSYQQSCDQWNEQMVNGNGATYPRLAARCKTFNGNGTIEALLDLSQCSMSGDIQNDHGTLLCAPAPSTPPPTAPPAATPGTCIAGFVWRMVDAQDHVCVTPQTRQQVVDDDASAPQHTVKRDIYLPTPAACLAGYVWRLADAKDDVCVTPQTRSSTAADNAAASSRTN